MRSLSGGLQSTGCRFPRLKLLIEQFNELMRRSASGSQAEFLLPVRHMYGHSVVRGGALCPQNVSDDPMQSLFGSLRTCETQGKLMQFSMSGKRESLRFADWKALCIFRRRRFRLAPTTSRRSIVGGHLPSWRSQSDGRRLSPKRRL